MVLVHLLITHHAFPYYPDPGTSHGYIRIPSGEGPLLPVHNVGAPGAVTCNGSPLYYPDVILVFRRLPVLIAGLRSPGRSNVSQHF